MNSDAITRVVEAFQLYIGEINQSSAMRINSYCDDYTEENLVETFKACARAKVTTWRYIDTILEKNSHKVNLDRFADQGAFTASVHSDAADIMETWNKRRRLV